MARMMGFRLHGDKALMRKLRMLRASKQRGVVRPALNKALTPVNKAVKAGINETEWKPLRKAIGKRVQTYSSSGVIWGGIGARDGYPMRDVRSGGRDREIEAGLLLDRYEFGGSLRDGTILPAKAPVRRAFSATHRQAFGILKTESWRRLRALAARK